MNDRSLGMLTDEYAGKVSLVTPRVKEEYSSPVLQCYGVVIQLTQGSGSNNGDGTSMNMR